MKKFAGVAQQQSTGRLPTTPEVASASLAPRSTLQALVAGLQPDPQVRALGFADGMAGIWRLSAEEILAEEVDVLAYAFGFSQGSRLRRKGG